MEIPSDRDRTFREMFPIFKKEVDSLIKHIRGRYSWNLPDGLTMEQIIAAARLAHYGQIGFKDLTLQFKDLSTIPGEHLCSLASSVREIFDIQTVRGCDLVKIIDSVRSNKLGIFNQNLDREATEALVRAMNTRIEFAAIGYYKKFKMRSWGFEEEDIKWILDMEALTKYNGKGRCKNIYLRVDWSDNYRQRLRDWAQDRDWSVAFDHRDGIGVKRETEIPNLLIKNPKNNFYF